MGRNNKQNRRKRLAKQIGRRRNPATRAGHFMEPRLAQLYDDGFDHESCIICQANAAVAGKLVETVDVSVEVAQAARVRLAAWLRAPGNTEDVESCRDSFSEQFEAVSGPHRDMLERVVDEWITCDVGWPETVAHELAIEAEAAGEAEMARALDAMHHSHLLLWQVDELESAGEMDRRYWLMRGHTVDGAPASAPDLEGSIPAFSWLAGRLWPAGGGALRLSPGALPYLDEVQMHSLPPDATDASRAVVEGNVRRLVANWVMEIKRVRTCYALLPPAA